MILLPGKSIPALLRKSLKPAPCASPSSSSTSSSSDVLRRRLPYLLAGLVQLVGMAIIGLVLTLPVPLVWPLLQSVLDHYGVDAALASVCLIYHCIGLLMCSMALVLRRLLFLVLPPGPGQCEVNSPMYLSWWFASRIVSVTYPVYMSHMRGTVVHTWWLRALGARIGKGVRLSRGVVMTDPDMTILHDNSVLGKCRLVGSIVRDGILTRGIVEVGVGAQVGTHAIMQPGSTLAEGAVLQPLSVAAEGQQLLPAHAVFEGAPASFLHPRSTFVARPSEGRTIPQAIVGILVFLIKATWGPLAAAFSARAIYPLTVLVFTRCHILKFFVWRLFHEGILLGALYTCIGLVPMLGIPILKAWWTVREYVYLFPDAVIEHMLAKLYGGRPPVSVEVFREMLGSPEWLEVVRRSMPEGIQLVGEAGDPHLMTVSSGRVVRTHTHRHKHRETHTKHTQPTHTYVPFTALPLTPPLPPVHPAGGPVHEPDCTGPPGAHGLLRGGHPVGLRTLLPHARPHYDGHGDPVLSRPAPAHAWHQPQARRRGQGAAARAQGACRPMDLGGVWTCVVFVSFGLPALSFFVSP